jgi:hypothetical protein
MYDNKPIPKLSKPIVALATGLLDTFFWSSDGQR